MMAPFVYEKARAEAPMHVQIWRPRIETAPHNDSVVRIDGRVVRIFRDRRSDLCWAQRVRFVVPIIDHASKSEPSGDIRHAWERIGPIRFLEAFLEAWEGQIHLVHSQIAPIRHPTLHPICGPDEKGFLCQGNR